MSEAYRDGNFVTTLLGTSSSDGVTPINVYVDPVTHRLLVDINGGAGDVVGPSSSTDNAVVRFDGTTGKLIQNSSATLSDAGVLTVTDIVTSEVKASGSGGLDILNSSGSQVALFGAGGSTGTSLFGTTNIGSASADYIQITGGTAATTFTATGSSTNIDITAVPKGSGAFKVNGAGQISGSFTLSGGTANGVLYLNGSKVATSGSALTFDGTNLKLGTTSSTNKLLIDTAVSNAGSIQLPRGAFIGFSNAADNANSEYIYANGGNLELGINGSTQLALNSSGMEVKQSQLIGYSSYAGIGTNGLAVAGNVGIGTSSPAFKLSVQGNAIIGGANPYLAFGSDASVGATPTYIERNGTTGLQTFYNNGTGTNGAMAFVIGAGSEGMRLTSTGLGIGTSSPTAKLTVDTSGTSGYWERFYNSGTELAYFYFDATTLQLSSKSATRSLTFLTNDTERMRLDSAGNVGIGTSSPSTKLTVSGVTFTDNGVTGGASGLVYALSASNGSNFGQIGNTGTRWSLGYGPSLTALGTEVLTWNSSDNVGIGTSSPSYKLDVSGTGHFTKTVSFDEFDNGNSSTADTIDWTQGNKQKSTLTGNCTYTFTAPGGPASLILKLVQDATGSRTVTWPAAVHWSGGTAPTLTTTANKVDIITFYYDGTTYFGNSTLNFTA